MGNYVPAENKWGKDQFTPSWWPGVINRAILYDDTFLEVNGQPYTTNARQVYAAAYAAGDRQVTLTIQRKEIIITRELPLVRFTLRYLLDLKTADYLMGVCLWLLALAIYRAQRRAPLNRISAILFAQSALDMFALPATIFRHTTWLEHFTLFVANPLTASLLWASFFKFAILFPKPIWQDDSRLHLFLRRWTVLGVYSVAITMSISEGLALLMFWTSGWSPLVGWLDWWGYRCALYGIGFVGSIMFLRCLWEVRPGNPSHQRRRMALVVIGFALGTPYLFENLIPGLINLFPGRLDLRFLALAVPISLAAIILRYRTFLADRSGFVLVTEIATSAILASFATAFVPDPGASTGLPPFVPIFIATFLASQLWSWLTSSKGWFWNLLYREELAQRSVKDFGQDVAQSFTSTQLPSVIAKALIQQFRSDVAVIYQSTESNLALTGLTLAGCAGGWRPPEQVEVTPTELMKLERPILIGPDAPTWLAPLRAGGKIAIVAPMLSVDQTIGLLGIGRREGEEIFDTRDVDAVEIVAQQCALFLQAAEQLEALRRVPLEIEQAQEQERQRIAIDLHDSLQQFLGGLQFPLELSRKLVIQDPVKTDAYLSQMIRDVDRSAKVLRQISHNLMPRDLQKGLREPLQALVEEYRMRRSLDIRLMVPDDLDEGLGLDERHAIRSVVRQALDNIVAHAHATEVDIEFSKSDSRLEFRVADNGCGFSEADRQRAQAEKRLGLISMPARIVAVRGELKIESEPGQGTHLRGWVPIQPGNYETFSSPALE